MRYIILQGTKNYRHALKIVWQGDEHSNATYWLSEFARRKERTTFLYEIVPTGMGRMSMPELKPIMFADATGRTFPAVPEGT